MVDFRRQAWFAREILIHEGHLRGYLRRFLRRPSDLADAMQETYARLLGQPDAVLAQIRSPQAFLFRIARNIALEWLRRQRTLPCDLMAELSGTLVLDESPSAYEQLSAIEELQLLARAIASLPERCRQVLTLRKLYGLSQKQIAASLDISENTVEKQAANGVRLCAAYVRAHARGEPAHRSTRARWIAGRERAERHRAGSERVDRAPGRGTVEPAAARGVRGVAAP
jgi:RNA polymerase sigma factor (sigma-70 family)